MIIQKSLFNEKRNTHLLPLLLSWALEFKINACILALFSLDIYKSVKCKEINIDIEIKKIKIDLNQMKEAKL